AVVDLSGRPYLVHSGEPAGQEYHLIGGHFTGALTRHVFESIAHHAAITLHVRLLAGRDPHHIVEAQFKALARALRAAVEPDPRVEGIPSTKGALCARSRRSPSSSRPSRRRRRSRACARCRTSTSTSSPPARVRSRSSSSSPPRTSRPRTTGTSPSCSAPPVRRCPPRPTRWPAPCPASPR